VNAGHLDIIPKTSVGIAISIIVIWTPFLYRTILYITILTEDSRNGAHRTIIFITISTEVLWNGVQITSTNLL
jgi:hypothetical protein